MPTTPLTRLLDTSKVLANRGRLRIVAALEGNELCVLQVAAIFDIAGSTASEHLTALRKAGLVVDRRDGRFVFFSLSTEDRARRFLAVVLDELASDAVVEQDREMTEKVLSLPHELVCEHGRVALELARTALLASREPLRNSWTELHTNTKEAP
jgi:DNA-binding transcriptional ArsR family regulator